MPEFHLSHQNKAFRKSGTDSSQAVAFGPTTTTTSKNADIASETPSFLTRHAKAKGSTSLTWSLHGRPLRVFKGVIDLQCKIIYPRREVS